MCRQDAFTLDVLEVPQGSGSGFVWDKDGHIVTNYHVIRGASDLRLVSFDGVMFFVGGCNIVLTAIASIMTTFDFELFDFILVDFGSAQ